MEQMINTLAERYHLAPLDLRILLENAEELRFRKKTTLVAEGERNPNLYLIKEGIWRGYYYKEGVDTTIWFGTPGEAIFSVWSYAQNSPSQISIEAMSDSTLYCIRGEVLRELYNQSIGLANLGRKLMEQHLLSIENWLISAGQPKAKERYTTLLKETPELIRHVPLKHIASYLWITPQSLSRIRREV